MGVQVKGDTAVAERLASLVPTKVSLSVNKFYF